VHILHVISTVGNSAPVELQTAQRITLESIEVARNCAQNLDITVAASRFADEPLPAEWLNDFPCLRTSASDLWGVPGGPRLPLLREILEPIHSGIDFDYVVFSNIDIGLQSYFYQLVNLWARSGIDAVNVTRRNVDSNLTSHGLAAIQASIGRRHPGSDCFIFAAEIAHKLTVGEVSVGLPQVTRTMALNLWLRSNRYRKLGSLHATFHLGNEESWRSDAAKLKLREHNAHALADVLDQLREEFGSDSVDLGFRSCLISDDGQHG